jgi:hypothetical protein
MRRRRTREVIVVVVDINQTREVKNVMDSLFPRNKRDFLVGVRTKYTPFKIVNTLADARVTTP